MSAAASNVPEQERLYRIGHVSRLTDTKPFVLRFWETEFPMLQPVKAPKGHRLYRQSDIQLIRAIKRLLYEEGFTIAGARRHLAESIVGSEGDAAQREQAPLFQPLAARGPDSAATTADARGALMAVGRELRAILTLLGTK